MKPSTLLLTFLSIAAFGVGCGREETATQQMDKTQAGTNGVARDMKDQTQKSEFVQQMEARLAELDQDLEKLSLKIESASAAFKAEARPRLQALREQRVQLNTQLGEVRNAGESTWNDVKAGSQKAYDELKDSFQQAQQWVSDKVAP